MMHAYPLIERTSDVVSAYVKRNAMPVADLPSLIRRVHSALAQLGAAVAEECTVQPTPTQIDASVGQEHLISFVDGKPYRTLRRHLRTHGLTPEGYRARYGLSADYPMVAPGYASVRSRIAKQTRLGTKAL